MSTANPTAPKQIEITLPKFLRDLRVLQAISQILFVLAVITALSILIVSVAQQLQARGAVPNYTFLSLRSGIPLSEAPDWYDVNDTFFDTFTVGIINTLRVVSIGLVLSTILGVFLGIFLLSSNWLIRTISRTYVEILRNSPLLVQLYFWYYVFMLNLPRDETGIPGEGIFVIPLRAPLYIILGILIWLFYARRTISPPGVLGGVLLGAVGMELIIAVFGYNLTLMLILAIIGGAAFFFAERVTKNELQVGRIQGIGLLFTLQYLAALGFTLLERIGALSYANATWLEVHPAFFISRSGFISPEFLSTQNTLPWLGISLLGLIIAIGLNNYWRDISERTGRFIPRTTYATLVFLVICGGAWLFFSNQPAPDTVTVGDGEEAVTMPVEQAREEELLTIHQDAKISSAPLVILLPQSERTRFGTRILSGSQISPEYAALLIGLVIYTSAFIGEIVRAGIQAVPYGQIEAARSLGLTMPQTLRLIILPQALRVIIPPMGNQYLNLSKNSSLATAIAFADTYAVGLSIMNTSGQSITGFSIVLLVYLTMSLVISAVMNFVNSRFQLVTR
ncbi:MAG: hypothetical protein Kow00117_00420 [Phototrophicales bacterium]